MVVFEEKLDNKEDNYNILEYIRTIQSSIEIINSNIATPSFVEVDCIMKKKNCQIITENMIKYLELNIDNMEKSIPKLTKFILPGVTIPDSECHLCRTQTRKCERIMWNYLNETNINNIDKNILIYEQIKRFLFCSF